MRKSMIAVVIAASALVGVMYSLPKVIVSDKNKSGQSITAAQTASDTSGHLSDNHQLVLSPAQTKRIDELRNKYLSDTNKEKKLKFADSLATFFAEASQPDSAAKYWETIALAKPTTAHLLQAGNGYYNAFGFTVDTQKANQLGVKARQYFQQVLDKDPSVYEAKTKMAMTYVTTDNPMQGIMLLREVLANDPKNELALFNLGLLSIRSGQYDKAIERFTQVLKQNPDNGQAQYYLGVCYYETGNKSEAKRIFTQVKQRESDPAVQASVDEYLEKLH